ncbi:hypothetical protein VCHA53P481_90085 [Vibrio chagasii]|nr:hypothetical protein VCHA32O87_90120 [Vibrio chagasii]CAH7419450.1 hypothetical protein VCHA43P284_90119 [Vibrio chagasii]CAH7435365.1 hypothetical protein VCHA53P481_90085 [Vibrio chagasii]
MVNLVAVLIGPPAQPNKKMLVATSKKSFIEIIAHLGWKKNTIVCYTIFGEFVEKEAITQS